MGRRSLVDGGCTDAPLLAGGSLPGSSHPPPSTHSGADQRAANCVRAGERARAGRGGGRGQGGTRGELLLVLLFCLTSACCREHACCRRLCIESPYELCCRSAPNARLLGSTRLHSWLVLLCQDEEEEQEPSALALPS